MTDQISEGPLRAAHDTINRVGGFNGNGIDELGPAASALALISIAESLKLLAAPDRRVEPRVTQEMLDRAFAAYQECPGNGETWGESHVRALRAALEAAIGGA